MNEQVKSIQGRVCKLVLNPMIPADVRALLADTSALLAELVKRVNQLELSNDGKG